jgi:hypothetical protein
MTRPEAVLKFSKWKEDNAPLKVIFEWQGIDVRAGAVSDVNDDWLILVLENGKLFSIPFVGAVFETGEPSEAPLDIRGASISEYICCVEISLPHKARCLLYEMKRQ